MHCGNHNQECGNDEDGDNEDDDSNGNNDDVEDLPSISHEIGIWGKMTSCYVHISTSG